MVEAVPDAAVATVASGGHNPSIGTNTRPKLSWYVAEEEGLSVQQTGVSSRAPAAHVVVQVPAHSAAEMALHGQLAVWRGLPF